MQLCAGLVTLGAVLYLGAHTHDWIALRSTPFLRLALLFTWTSGAGAIYFATLWICGVNFKELIHHKV
jgi:putative peptidoglycan lipid II flippase